MRKWRFKGPRAAVAVEVVDSAALRAAVGIEIADGHYHVLVLAAARERRLGLRAVAGDAGDAELDIDHGVEDRVGPVCAAGVGLQIHVPVRKQAAAGGHTARGKIRRVAPRPGLHGPEAGTLGRGPAAYRAVPTVAGAAHGIVLEARLDVAISLKIMASGSWYLAVKSRIGQSSVSADRPFHKGASFVRNGSGLHEPGSGEAASPSVAWLVESQHPASTSTLDASAAAGSMRPVLQSARMSLASIPSG